MGDNYYYCFLILRWILLRYRIQSFLLYLLPFLRLLHLLFLQKLLKTIFHLIIKPINRPIDPTDTLNLVHKLIRQSHAKLKPNIPNLLPLQIIDRNPSLMRPFVDGIVDIVALVHLDQRVVGEVVDD